MYQPMRIATLVVLLLSLLATHLLAGGTTTHSSEYTAYVTIKVREAQQVNWSAVEQQLSAYNDIEIDFLCRQSGIMVWRIVHTMFSEEADIQVLVRNRLAAILMPEQLVVLDIYVAVSPAEGNC